MLLSKETTQCITTKNTAGSDLQRVCGREFTLVCAVNITNHSCYQRAFQCMEYRPRIRYVNFDLANSSNGKCCSSKTISAKSSAEVSKSSQRDALHFLKENLFLRGFPFGLCWFLSCIWVSRKCAKSFVRFRPLVWICYS